MPVALTGSSLEAKTLFKSPDFPDSYDFPYNPDPYCAGNNYDTYDEMRDDDQIKAVIAIKKDMVINTGWKIECEDEEIKEFVEEALRGINELAGIDASFEDSLRDVLSAYEYGFSLTEPVYAIEEGKYIYKSLKTRPPHTFKFEIDDRGNVTAIKQNGANGELSFKPDLFVHHVYQQEFGNPYGKSDLRAAHNSWKAKKFVQRFLAIYLERFAQPTVVGSYGANFDPGEIQRFHDLLKKIQATTAFAIPEGVKIDLLYPQRDGSDSYIKAIDLFNMQIARSILVPDLMGIGGTATKGGSFALGKEQFKVFLGTIDKDRQSLARKITLKLVRPLVQINFGDVECDFKFTEYTEDDISQYADLWIRAVSGKIFKPNPEEINHLRSVTGFPEGDVEFPQPLELGPDGQLREPKIGPDGKPIPPKMGPDGKPIPPKPGETPQDREKAAEEKTGKEVPKKDQNAPPKPKEMALRTFRQATAYEKKVDFALIREVLDSAEASISPGLRQAARRIYQDYLSQIREKGLVRNFQPEKINALQPKFLREMNVLFKNHFRDLFRESLSEAQKELIAGPPKKYSDPLLPEEFEEILNAESFKVVGEYSAMITKKAKNILVNGIKEGRSEADIVAAIRELAADETESWLATVVRTKTTEVYNMARRTYWETDETAKQIVTAYQFSAIIDSRTSEVCAELDGKIFDLEDDIARITPPLHFNCRSLLVPVTRYEEYKTENVPSIEKIQGMGGGLKNFIAARPPEEPVIVRPEVTVEPQVTVQMARPPKVIRVDKEVIRDEVGKVIGLRETPIYEEEK